MQASDQIHAPYKLDGATGPEGSRILAVSLGFMTQLDGSYPRLIPPIVSSINMSQL